MRHLIAAALFAPIVSAAQQPPLDFKGVPFGSSQDDLRQLALTAARSFNCIDKAADGWQLCVVDGISYAGAEAKKVHATYQDDRLIMVTVYAPSEAFSNIAAALAEKFGSPKSDERGKVQNRMGATFEQQILTWAPNGDYVAAHRFDDNLNTSKVTMASADGMAIIKRRAAAMRAKQKKDI